jgi:hypothetical protein
MLQHPVKYTATRGSSRHLRVPAQRRKVGLNHGVRCSPGCIRDVGASKGTRTLTILKSPEFETGASAIPPCLHSRAPGTRTQRRDLIRISRATRPSYPLCPKPPFAVESRHQKLLDGAFATQRGEQASVGWPPEEGPCCGSGDPVRGVGIEPT